MVEKNGEELKDLLKDGKKVLVDVYGVFCNPCKLLLPKIESFESEYPDVTFVKMNVQHNMPFASEMEIKSVPTVMIFNGETLVNRSIGIQSDSYYREILGSI